MTSPDNSDEGRTGTYSAPLESVAGRETGVGLQTATRLRETYIDN